MLDLRVDRSRSLTVIAAERLGEAIVRGQLGPGDRLVETELSERMGISRAPLREALRELAGSGLVTVVPGRGTYVAKPTAETMEHMVLLRGLVEGAAARVVAGQRDVQSLTRLEAACNAVEEAHAAADDSNFLDLHWRFHRTICVESGNPFLVQSWDGVSSLIRIYLRMAVGQTIEADKVMRNNRAFLRVLRDGDPVDAEELLRSQIIRVAYQLLERPLPASAAGYVTRYVDEGGRVRSLER